MALLEFHQRGTHSDFEYAEAIYSAKGKSHFGRSDMPNRAGLAQPPDTRVLKRL